MTCYPTCPRPLTELPGIVTAKNCRLRMVQSRMLSSLHQQGPQLCGTRKIQQSNHCFHSDSNHMKTSVATQNANWQRSNIRFANDNVGPIWSEIDI